MGPPPLTAPLALYGRYASDGLSVLSGGADDARLRLWRVEDDEAKAGSV